jgi:DNA replication protein DnaC
MLRHPTLEQLHQLGLIGMAKAFEELGGSRDGDALGFDDRLAILVEREAAWRASKRTEARLRQAKLRQRAAVEDVDYRTARGLDRALFHKLIGGQWIAEHQNLLITGPCGVGKSWLACALAHKACRDNRRVLYARLPRLLEDLALARADGRYPRLLKSLARIELLVLDDWGLAPPSAEQRRDLLEIVDDRHDRASTLITSQLPVDRWHDMIGDPTLADAILDRLVHNAHRIALTGDSLRRRAAKASAKPTEP